MYEGVPLFNRSLALPENLRMNDQEVSPIKVMSENRVICTGPSMFKIVD